MAEEVGAEECGHRPEDASDCGVVLATAKELFWGTVQEDAGLCEDVVDDVVGLAYAALNEKPRVGTVAALFGLTEITAVLGRMLVNVATAASDHHFPPVPKTAFSDGDEEAVSLWVEKEAWALDRAHWYVLGSFDGSAFAKGDDAVRVQIDLMGVQSGLRDELDHAIYEKSERAVEEFWTHMDSLGQGTARLAYLKKAMSVVTGTARTLRLAPDTCVMALDDAGGRIGACMALTDIARITILDEIVRDVTDCPHGRFGGLLIRTMRSTMQLITSEHLRDLGDAFSGREV